MSGENIYGEASNHIYEFTVPAGFTGGFTFSTCNGTGGWDTYLRVIDPSSGQQIAHNDDSCDLLSTVTLPTGPNEPGEPGGYGNFDIGVWPFPTHFSALHHYTTPTRAV